MSVTLTLRTKLLWCLDRLFPPDRSAFMSAAQQTIYEMQKASRTVSGYVAELASSDVDVLDYGCGWGGETIWLAGHVSFVTGVDIDSEAILHARLALQQSAGVTNCRFECAPDGRLPFADESFDAVFSTDTFEHVMDLDLAFTEIFRVLRPGGSLLARFGPLFFSPRGYHLYWACQVPYAHLLFGLEPILELRRVRAGCEFSPRSWKEMGLNRKRFGQFRASALKAGFGIEHFSHIPVRRAGVLARLPLLQDLFIFGVDCRLKRPPTGKPQ